jgi:hypothetical protein
MIHNGVFMAMNEMEMGRRREKSGSIQFSIQFKGYKMEDKKKLSYSLFNSINSSRIISDKCDC